MLALTLAAAMAVQPAENPSAQAALQLCRTQAREAPFGRHHRRSTMKSSLRRRGTTVINGSVTALIGMGQPGSGYAGTHHLIRAEYSFICRADDTRVRKITINRLHFSSRVARVFFQFALTSGNKVGSCSPLQLCPNLHFPKSLSASSRPSSGKRWGANSMISRKWGMIGVAAAATMAAAPGASQSVRAELQLSGRTYHAAGLRWRNSCGHSALLRARRHGRSRQY